MADPASVESDLAIVDSLISAAPSFPRYYVPRPRLHRQIDHALDEAQLVLIRAPAVSGKTTLLRAWSADTETHTASINLGPLDNDPAHFWARFADAVGLRVALPVSSLAEARRLVERCRSGLAPTVLVLDRINLLDDPDVTQVLGELLVDLPETLAVILAGRAEPAPALRTGLLRARGQLAEIRPDDLAFRRDETAALLANLVELTPEQLDELHARTEGWIGGVTLAGLALLRAPDRTAMVEAMTGSNRYIAELLAAEVMDPQPADVQAFLLATSVLDTMDSALVNAVTGERGGARLLDALEASGLFIEATDDSRSSYRYRPLFREFLRHRLHVHDPDREVAAHLGAARQYEQRGDIGAAVAHYVDAGDAAAAVRLVTARGEGVAAAGHVDMVADWIARLPIHGLQGDVTQLLAIGRLSVTIGMLDEAAVWIDAARMRLEGSDDQRLLAAHALLAAYTDAADGDLEHAVDECLRVLTLVTDEDGGAERALRARAHQLLVGIYATFGRLDEARRHNAATPPDAIGLSPSQAYSAWLGYRLGLLDHAMSYAEEVIRSSDVPWHMGAPLITRGAVRRERHQLENAEPDLIAGIDTSRRWSRFGSLVIGEIELARLRFAQRREAEAFALLTEARPHAGGPFLTQLVAVTEVTLHLRSGDVQRATFGREELSDGPLTAPLDVRLALATGRLDDVPEPLALYEASAKSLQKRIVSHLLRARFALALDDPADAAHHVRQALEWGRRERFVQIFATDLPALEPVLRQVVVDHDDPYPFSLLAAVAEPMPAGAATLPLPADFEPLSEREQIVLRYLPTALSNKRIAAELHMSVNTLKTHLKSIYRKLRAASRDESVAHARELHLL